MQSSHTMSCVIAANPVQVTRRGVWWGGRNEVGRLHLPMIPPLRFDSADPVSRHIARGHKADFSFGLISLRNSNHPYEWWRGEGGNSFCTMPEPRLREAGVMLHN